MVDIMTSVFDLVYTWHDLDGTELADRLVDCVFKELEDEEKRQEMEKLNLKYRNKKIKDPKIRVMKRKSNKGKMYSKSYLRLTNNIKYKY